MLWIGKEIKAAYLHRGTFLLFYQFGQYVNSIGGCNESIEGKAGRVNAAPSAQELTSLERHAEVLDTS
jgi:hypothetical protein